MSPIPRPPRDSDPIVPDDADPDRLEIEIHRRQKNIVEADETYMKAPEDWPEPPDENDLAP